MLQQNNGLGTSRGRKETGEANLQMAGWTVEGGALGTDTKGKINTSGLGCNRKTVDRQK